MKVTWIWICEQRAYREQDFSNSQGRAPLVLQNVQADGPCAADIAVVDACAKHHLYQQSDSLLSYISRSI